jgi:hypothetical protein
MHVMHDTSYSTPIVGSIKNMVCHAMVGVRLDN